MLSKNTWLQPSWWNVKQKLHLLGTLTVRSVQNDIPSNVQCYHLLIGFLFQGETKHGMMDGRGILSYPSGVKYLDCFFRVYVYLFLRYEGQFSKGKREGMGRMYYPDGKGQIFCQIFIIILKPRRVCHSYRRMERWSTMWIWFMLSYLIILRSASRHFALFINLFNIYLFTYYCLWFNVI